MPAKYRMCCLTKNKTNPAYVGAQIGAARLAKRLGCEVVGYVPEKPDDIDEQRDHIEAAIASRPDAILVSPVHTTALNDSLQKVVDAKIALVFFVTSAEGIRANTFITSDNYTLAKNIAGYLIHHLGGTGDIAILEGLPQSPTSAPRTKAFLDAAAEHPGINVVARAIGNYQRAEGKAEMAKDPGAAQPARRGRQRQRHHGAGRARGGAGGRTHDHHGRHECHAGRGHGDQGGKLLATVSYDALSLVAMAVQAAGADSGRPGRAPGRGAARRGHRCHQLRRMGPPL